MATTLTSDIGAVTQISGKDSVVEGEDQLTLGALFPDEIYWTVRPQPVMHQDDGGILFNPDAMEVGIPYTFRFLDHYMFVVKSPENALDVYYFDNPAGA